MKARSNRVIGGTLDKWKIFHMDSINAAAGGAIISGIDFFVNVTFWVDNKSFKNCLAGFGLSSVTKKYLYFLL